MSRKTEIGARIRSMRLARDLNQGEVAFHLGVSNANVIHIEQGKQWVSVAIAIKLAALFKVSTDQILGVKK